MILLDEERKYVNDLTSSMIKETHDIIMSNSSQFLSGTPLKCTYFNIDRRKSSYGYGNKEIDNYYNGSIKYKKINNFLIHFISDQISPEEDNETGMDWLLSEGTFEAYIIPDTRVKPNVGDRVTFDFDGNKTLFVVNKFIPDTTLLSRPVVKIELSRDSETYARRDDKDMPIMMSYQGFYDLELLSGEYEFRYEFIGTEYSSVIESSILVTLTELQRIRNELNDQYIDLFYNSMYDTIISFEESTGADKAYIIPYLIDLQREFKLLRINDNQLILNHLTLINTKHKQSYKVSNLRKFFKQNKADIGEVFYDASIYQNDRLYSPINNTVQQFTVIDILRSGNAIDNSTMTYSDTVTEVLDLHKRNQLDFSGLQKLKDYEIDFKFSEIIGVFLMLYLLDSFIKKTLERIREEEFY